MRGKKNTLLIPSRGNRVWLLRTHKTDTSNARIRVHHLLAPNTMSVLQNSSGCNIIYYCAGAGKDKPRILAVLLCTHVVEFRAEDGFRQRVFSRVNTHFVARKREHYTQSNINLTNMTVLWKNKIKLRHGSTGPMWYYNLKFFSCRSFLFGSRT